MAQMPLAEPAADVVEQAQHIGLVRIQPGGRGDLLRTVGGGAAMVSPRAGVVGQGFGQQCFGLFTGRVHCQNLFSALVRSYSVKSYRGIVSGLRYSCFS